MKEIKAIIQPFLADHVVSLLREMPEAAGITVSSVTGFGRGALRRASYTRKKPLSLGEKRSNWRRLFLTIWSTKSWP